MSPRLNAAWLVLLLAGVGNTQQLQDRSRPAIVVGQEVHISTPNPTAGHTEFFSDADPVTGRAMVCIMYFKASINRIISGAYVSADTGRSWKLTNEHQP